MGNKEVIVKISTVTLRNFMNIDNGRVRFFNNIQREKLIDTGDILGLYGQNGSGKTSFIHALAILKYCMGGKTLPKEYFQYIQTGATQSVFSYEFIMEIEKESYMIFYDFSIKKNGFIEECHDSEPQSVIITDEIISYKKGNGRKQLLFQTHGIGGDITITPKKVVDSIRQNNNFTKAANKIETKISVAGGVALAQRKSVLFSRDFMSLFTHVDSRQKELFEVRLIMVSLSRYANEFLYIIGTKDSGLINLDIAQPIHFRLKEDKRLSFGNISVSIGESALMPETVFQFVTNVIKDMNIVLSALVPQLSIKLISLGRELDSHGQPMIRTELLSSRDGRDIPIRYESAGIKKIINLLHVFIGAYNNPCITVAVDELDAGIFEYLLGEMLSVFNESGKGQLIFTSHNLRPLEVLNKASVIFTTTNPQNRYVRLTHVKPNNNLRDVYYRTILLGGEKENLYGETNRDELSYALRKAGRDG